MWIARRVALGLAAVLATLALLVLLGTVIPSPFVFGAPLGEVPDRRILLVSNTIHTDIAVPLDAQTLAALDFLGGSGLPTAHPDARWLLIGWGGRSFYLETPTLADVRPGPLFRALTLDRSVIHVDVVGAFGAADPAVREVAVTEAGYANLLSAISASFSQANGEILPIENKAYGFSDRFFEAEGYFNALLGCNTWTAGMLRSAGISTGLWNPIPPSLDASVRLFNTLPGR